MATIKTTIKRRNGTGWDELRPKTEVDQITDFDANVPDNLDDLTNVNAPSPSDGQALVWDNSTSKWVPGTVETPEFASSYTTIASNGWNDYALGRGIFSRSNSSGLPSGGTHGYWLTLGRRDVLGGYAGIYVNDYSTSGSGVYIGRNDSGGNPTWEKVWTDKTDGTGSGLDADTLDTYHASQFLRSDADDTYTGTLTLANDSYISMPAGNAEGIKFGDVVMSYVGTSYDDLTIRNLKQLRFGSTNDWDWNKWAGIGYDTANFKMYIGGPASSYFQSNTSPSNIDVVFDGVDNVGIGTTSPGEKLEVNGKIKANNEIIATKLVDYNNGNYYLDPASTSVLNVVDASLIKAGTDDIEIRSGTISVGGDADTYYPVTWYSNVNSQAFFTKIQIYRNYNETAPNTWNTSTHKGGLLLDLQTNWGGWGGVNYDIKVNEFSELYSNMVAKIGHFANNRGFAIWLRGGTATYHFYTEGVKIDPTVQLSAYDPGGNSSGVSSVTSLSQSTITDKLYYRSGALYDTGNRVLTTASTIDADTLGSISAGSFLRSDANDTASGTYTFTGYHSGNTQFYGTDTTGGYSNAPIEIREVNLVTTGQSSSAYAPGLAFHWGGRVQTQIKLHSDGNLNLSGNQTGRLLTTADEGSGNGLDADTLDGSHASAFATLASPALTGTPTAPTASSNTNNTQIATTAFVSNKIAGIAGGLNFKGTVSLATSKSGDDLYGTGSGQISSTGDYVIVSNAGDITNPATRIITLAAESPGDESDSTLPITLEVGDWIMYESFSSQTLTVVLLNNNDASKAAAVHTHSNYITSNAADTATGKITFTGDIAIDDTDDHAYRIGKDSYDTNMTGISIRPDDEVNPASGDILFTVRSGGGSPRFFVEHAGRIGSTNSDFYLGTGSDTSGGNRVFHDGYHPNADKWTTARTLSLSGDASGSVSWDGSANATLSVTVADDSHSHTNYAPLASPAFTGDVTMSGSLEIAGDLEVVGNTIGFVDNNFDARIQVSDSNPNGTGAVFDFYGDGVSRNATLSAEQFDGNAATTTKWLTPRTITLGGDLSGSVSLDGSANVTLSAQVANNSHQHSQLYENSTITYGASYVQWTDQSGTGGAGTNGTAPRNPANGWYHNLIMNHANSTGYYSQISTGLNTSDIYFTRVQGGVAKDWQRIFADDYHPNADKWTTARTLSLTGDVTGSVSWDGSANASITTTVVNDSHNHDHSDGNFTVNGDLYGKSSNGQWSSLYRWGGIYFTWDSDSYGTNTHHSIRSTYGDNYGDDLTINSFHHLRVNLDSNSNNTDARFEIGHNTTGTGNLLFVVHENGDVGIGTGNTPGYKLNVNGDSYFADTVTIDTGTSSDALVIKGTTPTISLLDDDSSADDFYLHANSNNFYILTDRDGANQTGGGWESPHPLQLEADTNIGYVFGQRIFNEAYHPNADKWTTARTITLGGDLTGNVSIDGSANVTLTAAVEDNSHSHTISNVSGLQTALDDKAEVTYTSGGTTSDVSTLNFSLSGSTLTITTS